MAATRPRRPVPLRGRWHANKARLLEHRIDATHFRQRFNPRPWTQLARATNEVRPDPRSAIRRMQHDARQHAKPPIDRSQSQAVPSPAEPEEPIPTRQRQRRGREHADANRFVPMPQQRLKPRQGDLMAAVMPPREVRPVATGRLADPQVPLEADSFFLRPKPGFFPSSPAAEVWSIGGSF
jgi:hypothetical protein